MTEDQILRTDQRGRVHGSAERREAVLDEFEKSGLSGAAFAKLAGINYATFAGWRHRRARMRRDNVIAKPSTVGMAGKPMRLFEAVATSDRDAGALQLELPGGVRLGITSMEQVALAAELLRLMGSRPVLPC
jgi:hypothetical protein